MAAEIIRASDTGLVSRLHDLDGGIAIETVQDVEPILKACRALRDAGAGGSGEMRLAASFPMVVVETYCNTRGISFRDFMADPKHAEAMCNDPDLSKFRIWEGRV